MPLISHRIFAPGEKQGGWVVKLIPNTGEPPKQPAADAVVAPDQQKEKKEE
jgi:hypothetical protein